MSARSLITDSFKGVPFNGEWLLKRLPPIRNDYNHTVLFELPIGNDPKEPPKPQVGETKWNSKYVKLPCATENEYSVASDNQNKSAVQSKWALIQTALLQDIKSSRELEEAILSYNLEDGKTWEFSTLHTLFEDELDEHEKSVFFTSTLPFITRLALQLPDIVPASIPLLRSGQNRSISLSQEQIACILANAFLCTFPHRNEESDEYQNYPSCNFGSLFESEGDHIVEKIKCICHYFLRVSERMPTGVVTFTRCSLPIEDLPDWDECQTTFEKSLMHVCSDGTIEDDGHGLLQVDFANKYLGGGVLGQGCVQEEILFMIYPELMCARLFTEVLLDNECMLMLGCERFNYYSGYSSTFQWTGSFVDKTFDDPFRRRNCAIVALDAQHFKIKANQYKENMLKRELNKAFIGFKHDLGTLGVATGKWGCGVFNGDKYLKSMLQLMACCVTGRPLAYYTFGDKTFRDEFFNMSEYLSNNKVRIADLWHWLKQYEKSKGNLFEYVIARHEELREHNLDTSRQSLIEEDGFTKILSPKAKKKRCESSDKPVVKSSKNVH